MRSSVTVAALVLVATACSKNDEAGTAGDTGAGAAAAGLTADTTRTPEGTTGIPPGFQARTDDPRESVGNVRYTARDGNRLEIQTGPHHIIWTPEAMASAVYSASATIEQLEAPAHPESFGIFVGGTDLNGPNQKYGYFMVRGTGEYLVKVREGDRTRNVINWTAAPSVPKADASGRATYNLEISVRPDSLRFGVNGQVVATIPKANFPTEGLAGVRVGHNLHVSATQVVLSR